MPYPVAVAIVTLGWFLALAVLGTAVAMGLEHMTFAQALTRACLLSAASIVASYALYKISRLFRSRTKTGG